MMPQVLPYSGVAADVSRTVPVLRTTIFFMRYPSFPMWSGGHGFRMFGDQALTMHVRPYSGVATDVRRTVPVLRTTIFFMRGHPLSSQVGLSGLRAPACCQTQVRAVRDFGHGRTGSDVSHSGEAKWGRV